MPPEPIYHRSKKKLIVIVTVGIIFLFSISAFWKVSPPGDFPSGTIISIPEGRGAGEISRILAEAHVLRSPLIFRIAAKLLGERTLQAGQYYFARPIFAPTLVWRIVHGDHRIETAKLTVPEGFTVEKISNLFDKHFPFFDHREFLRKAEEGYLFPDTYFVPVSATASSTIKLMRDNFDAKVDPLLPEVLVSKHTLAQIVIMASLLEAEAKTPEDRAKVSDVLWKRLKLGMPLQVDSEMGTYEFQGLPDKPINNPGLVSITAAIHPTTTPYLYFISDKKGNMHYAKDFAAHQANISKYLTN